MPRRRGGGGLGGGGVGRYDTLAGLEPRHTAPITNENGMKGKGHDGGGSVCSEHIYLCFLAAVSLSSRVDTHTQDALAVLMDGL